MCSKNKVVTKYLAVVYGDWENNYNEFSQTHTASSHGFCRFYIIFQQKENVF